MSDLQAVVGESADRADSHASAPALLLRVQSALGDLARETDIETAGGRRPFRVPEDWAPMLGRLAYAVYLLGDQTGVSIDLVVRELALQVGEPAWDATAPAAG
ncbi:MAG: hypothetical protein JWN95_2005 [Frankiales bacterium]|nr:hypothetical protein [Frankiales bacterium]